MDAERQRQRIEKYIREAYGTPAEHLWAQYPDYAVFRHPSSRKWYAIIMDIPADKLGIPEERLVEVLNLKCGPLLLGSLLSERGFFPAYHMNKQSWVSVLLDGSVPDERLIPLLDLSYDSVAPKRARRRGAPEE